MKQRVRTAVIPVAGSGSRIRPLSLVMPKEMLATPYGPIIELITNELIDAGIEEIIYVTKPGKEMIENHLRAVTLHEHPSVKDVRLEFINQNEMPGNGGAILTAVQAKNLTEPFIVVWGDELFIPSGRTGRAAELIEAYMRMGKPCIMITEVAPEDVSKCGMVLTEESGDSNRLYKIVELVEKPHDWSGHRNYASVGGYIVTPEIAGLLSTTQRSADGEHYLSRALADYLKYGNELYGVLTDCEWHETGSMTGYVAAFEALAKKYQRERVH